MRTPVGGYEKGDNSVVVRHDIVFGDAQLEIKDVEKLALDPTNVTLPEHTGAHSPVYVLKRGVIQILQRCQSGGVYKRGNADSHFTRYNDGTEEYTFIGPLLKRNVKVRLSPVQIDKGGEDDRHFNLSPSDHVVDHCGESRTLGAS